MNETLTPPQALARVTSMFMQISLICLGQANYDVKNSKHWSKMAAGIEAMVPLMEKLAKGIEIKDENTVH